jgi:hypothetical protein
MRRITSSCIITITQSQSQLLRWLVKLGWATTLILFCCTDRLVEAYTLYEG